jgi:dihydroorotase
MSQMTIFECQKDKNMTRVKNKVINVKVVLEFINSNDIDNTVRNFNSATVHLAYVGVLVFQHVLHSGTG